MTGDHSAPTEADERTIRNEISGTVTGPALQVGVMRGDINLDIHPPLPPAAGISSYAAAVNLPRRPIDRLWGRQRPLAAVIDLLDQPAPGSNGVAVVGMAGVGKTELVLQVIRHRRARYPLTWWINGEDANTVQLGLANLAHHLYPDTRKLPPSQRAEWALDWLQSHDDWLIVLDNVEAHSEAAAMLARLDRGPVLLTSRWHLDWSARGLTVVELDTLARHDSVGFMLESVGSTDTEGAERMAADLGDLPLALRQASAYMREQGMAFDEYRQLLADDSHAVLDSSAWADVDRNNAARTLRLSIATVTAIRPDAQRLLQIACCFAPDRLPKRLLTLPGRDPMRHRSDLALLRAYSLVSPSDDTLSIHRLVQRLVRESIATGADEVAIAAAMLRAALPADPFNSIADWPQWLELAPHAEALDLIVATAGDRSSRVEQAATSHEIGTFMLAQGWTEQAERLLTRAAAARAEHLGPEDPATLDSQHRLSESLRALGKLPQARTLQEGVLAARLRVLGADDRRTLKTREALAITYKALGRSGEAIEQHEAILQKRIETLGSGDPDVLWSMHNLALTYKQAGRFDEALELHHQVLAERTRTLGPDHPDTLRCLHNIANTQHAAGRYTEAMSVQKRNIADRSRVLGTQHRDTLRSQSNLADTYLAAGLPEDAVHLHRRTLAQREETLGADNPDTRLSRERLAVAIEQLEGSSGSAFPAPPPT